MKTRFVRSMLPLAMICLAGCNAPGSSEDVTASLTTPTQFSGLKTNDWNAYAPKSASLVGVYQDGGGSFVDPTFGTTMKRIGTSQAVTALDSSSTSLMPFYSKEQAWSSDMAYVVTWSNDGSVQIFDGGRGMNGHTPYQLVRMLPEQGGAGFGRCGTDNEVRWSTDPATPQKMFHVCRTKFYVYDVAANTDTLLVDWAARFPAKGYSYVSSDAEGNPSSIRDASSGMYNRYWAFDAADANGKTVDVIIYDRFTDKVLSQVPGSTLDVCPGGSSGIDWIGMSPTGQYVIIVWGNTSVFQTAHAGCGVSAYSPSLTFLRQLMPDDWHGDVGFDAQKNEVFVGFYEPLTAWTPTSEAATMSSVRLSDGLRTQMQLWGNDSAGHTQSMYGGQAGIEFHVSMRGTVDPTSGIPGYALLSWYNGSSSTLAQYGATLFGSGEQNVLYVPGDGSVAQAKVWRINQTRSYRAGYDDEPHCVPSPDFTKTLCATNWSNTGAELPVYTLVTELAAGSPPPPPPPPTTTFSLAVSNPSPAAGGALTATFTAPAGEAATDSVGIFAVGAPDTAPLSSHSTNGATSGSIAMTAPATAGPYEVRYVTSANATKATVAICVGGSCSPPPPPPPPPSTGFSLAVDNAKPAAYGTVKATFTAPSGESASDLIGIFSVGANNWSWQYATKTGGATSGTLPLVAPGSAGKYEVRYVTSAWTTRAVVPICVGGGC
jgi:hypothetical protein